MSACLSVYGAVLVCLYSLFPSQSLWVKVGSDTFKEYSITINKSAKSRKDGTDDGEMDVSGVVEG